MGYNTDFGGQLDVAPDITPMHMVQIEAWIKEHNCDFGPDDTGTKVGHDGSEKSYGYVEQLTDLIEFMGKLGYTLNGIIGWDGEEFGDSGNIHVKDNRVQAIGNEIVSPDPVWD